MASMSTTRAPSFPSTRARKDLSGTEAGQKNKCSLACGTCCRCGGRGCEKAVLPTLASSRCCACGRGMPCSVATVGTTRPGERLTKRRSGVSVMIGKTAASRMTSALRHPEEPAPLVVAAAASGPPPSSSPLRGPRRPRRRRRRRLARLWKAFSNSRRRGRRTPPGAAGSARTGTGLPCRRPRPRRWSSARSRTAGSCASH
mmetsp:Transcript_27299/g.97578  ORF Transcript_27299/g.97578 Transcript_27299/m.97578 type:complete len:201 (-) Transcript_27299:269-871(-)